MLNKMKNIFFVSYLKNKGIRRICFILGVLFAIFPSASWYYRLNRHFYDLSFNNINEIQMSYEYNDKILKNVFYKYPVDFGKKDFFYNFRNWKNFFINKYSNDYKARKQLIEMCNDILSRPSDFQQPQKQNKLETCRKFNKYINQPIHISSYDFAYILELWVVIVAFYFPFLFCCLIRWVYKGFKEK